MVLVFDLDDTLYKELAYVHSGFRAVVGFLAKKYKLPPERLLSLMIAEEKKGRGKVFDIVLKKFNLYSKKSVKLCLSVYRSHQPKIFLYPDALKFFKNFKKYPIYIITDGNKLVQNNKIKALGLKNKAKKIFITRRYGLKREKPSPYCLEIIRRLEKVEPKEIIFIGDDPHKDFVGIKSLGFKTIRLRRGNHAKINLDKAHEADKEILSLNELKKYLRL